MERESSNTSNDDLMLCLSLYPLLVEFPLDQAVIPLAHSPHFHIADQEVTGLLHPGQCPLPTNVAQQTMEEIFLEHPMLDDQGRLPFQYKTFLNINKRTLSCWNCL